MGFTLTVKGTETLTFGEEMISAAHVAVDTPSDSMAKSSHAAATLFVAGKLLATNSGVNSNSATSELFAWSLVPAQKADSYRDVTVKVISEVVSDDGKPFREIHFPNAFVVNYSERYNAKMGVGEFSLTLRQKVDKMADVKSNK